MNVDSFVSIDFCEFDIAWIYIRVLGIIASMYRDNVYFCTLYIFSRIFEECE